MGAANGATVNERDVIDASMRELARGLKTHRAVFTALGDENRQRILIALLEHYGGLRAGEIAALVGLSRPAVSHHLKTLGEAGLVGHYSSGTKNFYHVRSSARIWSEISALANHAAHLAKFAAARQDQTACEIRRGE